MKYHLLPIGEVRTLKKHLDESINIDPGSFGLTKDSNQSKITKLKKELLEDTTALKKGATQCHTNEITTFLEELQLSEPDTFTKTRRELINAPSFYCLYDEESMKNLVGKLKPGDTVVLHGEGTPFLVGLSAPSTYDLDAIGFAQLLYHAQFPDNINIELYTCSSGVNFIDGNYNFNFARDTSEALHYLHGYTKIHVSGFAGLLVDKENGKFSVSTIVPKTDKRKPEPGSQLSIDAARITYLNGKKTGKSPEERSTEHPYSWAKRYIDKAKIGKDLISDIKKSKSCEAIQPGVSTATNSFFSGPTQTTTDDKGPPSPEK